MGETRELEAKVLAYFDNALAPHGLSRSGSRGYYRWPLSDGFEGWFSPMLGRRHTWIDVLPYVGVWSEAVEAMAHRLGGAGPKAAGTFSQPLSSVISEPGASLGVRPFVPDEPIEPPADSITEAFLRWGRPWVAEQSSLASLRPEGASGLMRPGAPFTDVRRLALFVLRGDEAGARRYMAEVELEARTRTVDPGGRHAALVTTWTSRLVDLLENQASPDTGRE